ncbi:MAG TPA: DUF4261 domain-containing protein [Pirellulaceae bacterium]|nr:DUF4261 domain-containing protein [Pirellulaceae bacterium]
MPATRDGKPLVAIIALKRETFPDLAAVVDMLAQAYPDEGSPAEATRGMDSAVFRWGGGPVAVALKSEPIAEADLAEACAAAWWWEQAAEQLARHKAHLLVSLAPSAEDAVARHLRLSRVVAVLLSQCDAAGVYWPGGGIVHEPQAFAEQAADLSPENLHPALWIDMHISPNDDESWSLYTVGLSAFDRAEIEIPSTTHDPPEVYELCADVIRYLLASGEKLEDGGVISRSDEEQVEVRYGPSMFDEEQTVMQLEF